MNRLPPLFRVATLLIARALRIRGADAFRLYRAVMNYRAGIDDGVFIEDCLPRRRSFRLYLAASFAAAFVHRPAVALIATVAAVPVAVMWAARIMGGL